MCVPAATCALPQATETRTLPSSRGKNHRLPAAPSPKGKNPKHSMVSLEMILCATRGLPVYTQVTSTLGVQMRGSRHEQGLSGNFWNWHSSDYYR